MSRPSSPHLPPFPSSRRSPFNFLRFHSSSRPNEGHYSTTLPTGSRTFLVEGRRFMLPKAILARNSEIFLEIGPDEGSTEITTLDDRAEAFEDFVDVLYDPFTSCLLQPSPSLRKVLHVLQISNKYCCDTIEGRARPLAIQMTAEETIRSHIGPLLSAVEVFRIAVRASVPSTYRNAWELILESFREHRISPRDLIDEGRRSGMSEFLGSAFYQVMLSDRKKWSTDESLTLSERQALTKGMLSCVDDWDAFVTRLASGNLGVPYRRLRHRSSVFHPEGYADVAIEADLPDSPAHFGVIDGDSEASTEVAAPTPREPHCHQHSRRQYNAELATISQIHAFHKVPTHDIIKRLAWIKVQRPSFGSGEYRDLWYYPSHRCESCWKDVVLCAEETKAFIESRLPFYFSERERRRSKHVVSFDILSDVDSLELVSDHPTVLTDTLYI